MAEAWWVYCVVDHADAGRVPAAPGVDGGAVETISSGELAAVVSGVPLPEYGDEELRTHLEDIAWVERVARAHEAVLEAAMAQATIVPLRLCTIYLSPDRVKAFLDEQAPVLRAALDDLRGRTEWGVKVFAPAAQPEPEPVAAGSYLARRRAELAAREGAQAGAARCAQDVHERLEREAVYARVNPPQRPEAHGRDTAMLLNGAYLVEDERRELIAAAVAELAGEYGPRGYSIELTGPWPPYNFVAS